MNDELMSFGSKCDGEGVHCGVRFSSDPVARQKRGRLERTNSQRLSGEKEGRGRRETDKKTCDHAYVHQSPAEFVALSLALVGLVQVIASPGLIAYIATCTSSTCCVL